MAKASIQEKIVTSHELKAEGTIIIEDDKVFLDTADDGKVDFAELFKNFNGEFIALGLKKKTEEEA